MIRPATPDTFVILLSVHINQSTGTNRRLQKPWTVAGEPIDGSLAQQRSFLSGLPQGATAGNRGEGPRSGERQAKNAIGNFYTQFAGILAAYDLPGGALTMVFTANNLVPVPDGTGWTYFVGTLN